MTRLPTEAALRDWRFGQTQAERLCAALMHLEGYEAVDPQSPLGGPDGTKDLLCRRSGALWIGAAYFPPTASLFAESKSKFWSDFKGVRKNSASGFAFFLNQPLTLSERDQLLDLSAPICTEIYHLERIRGLLDAPKGYGIRLEFLRIPMEEEEQLAFWSTMNYEMMRKLLDNEAHLKRVEEKVDLVLERTNALVADLRALPSSIVERPTGAWAAETPTEYLSIATVCWIHRIATEGDKLPEAVRGRLRAINVWIGPAGSVPENATFSPPNPTGIVQMMDDLFSWWTRGYRQLRKGDKEVVSRALAEFHHRFLRIHPFLDGNGRVARIVLDQAARELLNMRIGAELVADTKVYYDSLELADKGDLKPLHKLILAALL